MPIVAWIAIAAVVAAVISYRDFCYAWWGQLAVARVERTSMELERTGADRAEYRLRVDYSFRDAEGRERSGHTLLPENTEIQAGATISIEYLGGADGASRPVGRRSWAGPLILGACLTAGVARFAVRNRRQARERLLS